MKLTRFIAHDLYSYKFVDFKLQDKGLVLVEGVNHDTIDDSPSNMCLVGDTLIDCPRDLKKYPKGIPIRELVGKQFWTYVWKGDRIGLGWCDKVWCSKKEADTVRVKLTKFQKSNLGAGQAGRWVAPLELIGTPDHLVLLSDGNWKPLGDLKPGDSLCSLYRRGYDDRTFLRWTNGEGIVSEPDIIVKELLGEKPEGFHTHHKDGNTLNNVPENLEYLSASDHASLHLTQMNLEAKAGWQKYNVNHTVISVEKYGCNDVYDLSVPGVENFIANGVVVHNSGKSNLFEGILWTLFEQGTKEKTTEGTTVTGFSVSDVIREGTDHAIGKVVLEDQNGNEYIIQRERKRSGSSDLCIIENGVEQRGKSKAETQQLVNDLIGKSYDSFVQTVFFGQSTKRFTQAKDSERKQILEELLDLDFLSQAKDYANKQRLALSKNHSEIASNASKLEVVVDGLEARIKDAQEALQAQERAFKAWSENQESEIEEIQEKIDELEAKEQEFLSDINEKTEAKNLTNQDIEEWDIEPLQEKILNLTESIEEQREDIRRLNRVFNDLKDKRDTVQNEEFEDNICRLCQQPIDNKHIDKYIRDLEKEMLDVEIEAQEKEPTVEEDEAKLLKYESELAEYFELEVSIFEISDEIDGILRKLNHNNDLLEKYKADLKRVNNRTAPEEPDYSHVESLKIELAENNTKLEEFYAEIEILDEEIKSYKFWEDAFGNKGIKSLILDNILPILNQKTNEYLGNLLGYDTRVEFNTESTTATGKLKEIFDVVITSKYGGSGYHRCSGGQRRRVDFAIALALQTLQISRGTKINLFVCDEAIDSLDSGGVEGIMNVLKSFIEDNDLSCYFISHRSDLKDYFDFDNYITVEKNDGVSTLTDE